MTAQPSAADPHAGRRRVGVYLVGVTSALIFLSAFAHAWPGWAALGGALQERTDPAALAVVSIGWHFGSVAMAAFGILGVLSAVQMRRGNAQARWTPAVIGATYVLFGAAALFYRGVRPHFIAFIVLGGLLLAGVLIWSSARRVVG